MFANFGPACNYHDMNCVTKEITFHLLSYNNVKWQDSTLTILTSISLVSVGFAVTLFLSDHKPIRLSLIKLGYISDCETIMDVPRSTGMVIEMFTTMRTMVISGRNETRFVPPSLSQKVMEGRHFHGYVRSGQNFIGAMMNAHPNTVIANELIVLNQQYLHLIQQTVHLKQMKLQSKAALFNGP